MDREEKEIFSVAKDRLQMCVSRIEDLESSNKSMSTELNAMNRVLNAVNNHKPYQSRGEATCQDVKGVANMVVKSIDMLLKDIE